MKGWGLLASLLTLLHGLYLVSYFLWVLVLILTGHSNEAPVLNPLALVVLDTVVYLYLGVGMLRGRGTYFIYAVVWTVWGAVLATFAATYKGSVLNLLSFLIVVSCTYYHVSANKTNADVAKAMGQLAGIFSLIQGIMVGLALALTHIFHLRGWIILVPPFDEFSSASSLVLLAAAVTSAIYLSLGVGMLKNKKEFFLAAVFWVLIETMLALGDPSFVRTHYNIISMLILALATYHYSARIKAQ